MLALFIWAAAQTLADPAPSPKPLVVELFTSEGCSSCPPADALLLELANSQPFAEFELIPLGHHVDYWNSLGWTDPFSTAAATQRQYEYAARRRRLSGGRVYTPQVIVAGGEPVIGSQPAAVDQAIREAVGTQTATIRWQSDQILIEQLPEGLGQAEVFVAAIERSLSTAQIPRGENRGRTLHHPDVVRSLRRVAALHGSKTELPLSINVEKSIEADWNRDQLRWVAFVQEAELGRIRGAAIAEPEPGAAARPPRKP